MTKKNVLILDSDRVFLRELAGRLEEQGHRVVAAADVLACLDELVEFIPDVAIIDLFMPRIGGDDFCRIIRNIDYLQQCCLVLVGSFAGGEGLDLQALGVNVCIPRGTVAEVTARLGGDHQFHGTSVAGSRSGEAAGRGGCPGCGRRRGSCWPETKPCG